MNDYDVLIVPGGSVRADNLRGAIALVRLGKGLSLAEPELHLYPLLVEPDDPAVADLYHRHPVCPALRTRSRAAFGPRSRFVDFSSYYATVQNSAGQRRRE